MHKSHKSLANTQEAWQVCIILRCITFICLVPGVHQVFFEELDYFPGVLFQEIKGNPHLRQMDSVAAQVISLAMANICPTWKLAFYKSWWHVIPHEVACSFDLQESGSIFRRGKCFGKNWQEVFAKPMSASRSKGDWTCSVLCFWTVWDYKARQKTFIHFEDPGRQAGSARVCKGLQGSPRVRKGLSIEHSPSLASICTKRMDHSIDAFSFQLPFYQLVLRRGLCSLGRTSKAGFFHAKKKKIRVKKTLTECTEC